jgi:catalase (peroxidase I)
MSLTDSVLSKLANSKREFISSDEDNYMTTLVRTAWHSPGTFSKKEGVDHGSDQHPANASVRERSRQTVRG